MVAQGPFSDMKDLIEISMWSPLVGAPNAHGVGKFAILTSISLYLGKWKIENELQLIRSSVFLVRCFILVLVFV